MVRTEHGGPRYHGRPHKGKTVSMKYAILPLVFIGLSSFTSNAFAGEVELRGEIFCFPAKDVPKLVKKLSKVKEERRNIVDVRLEPRFIIKDGGVWPDRFYLATEGQPVMDLPFSRETGAVPSFLEAATERPDTDICVDDPTRAERPKDDEGLYFEMGLSPLFKSTTGSHSLAELKEAAKDAKKFYKKMLPDVVAMIMPDTDYFAIKMIDRSATPAAFVSVNGSEIELYMEAVKDMWVVSLDDIVELGADNFLIYGGDYDLQPVPSPKTLRRFGMGEATREE